MQGARNHGNIQQALLEEKDYRVGNQTHTPSQRDSSPELAPQPEVAMPHRVKVTTAHTKSRMPLVSSKSVLLTCK